MTREVRLLQLRSAETLRALMSQWGVSTRMLATRCGMHHSAVDHLRAGRRTAVRPEHARRIAEALHVTRGVLFEEPVQ